MDTNRAYYSTVLAQPADRIWALVRDFNNYPRYIEGVDQSLIEDDKPGDAVGAVRRFRYGGHWIRQRLLAHSDSERSFTYAGLEPFAFPQVAADESAAPPEAIDYEGTLRISPVTDGDRSFIEWWVNFEAVPADRERWQRFLLQAIPQWVGSLSKALS